MAGRKASKISLTINPNIKAINTKLRSRRAKANARERNRMHRLNEAFDKLRQHIPLQQSIRTRTSTTVTRAAPQSKLSKIETIRLAQNYIETLTLLLNHGNTMSRAEFWSRLVDRISQSTVNVFRNNIQFVNNGFAGKWIIGQGDDDKISQNMD